MNFKCTQKAQWVQGPTFVDTVKAVPQLVLVVVVVVVVVVRVVVNVLLVVLL